MSEAQNREETVFEAAAELAGEQRAAFLKEACGEDARLRQRIETLLAAHDRSSQFMEESAVPASTQRTFRPALFSEKPGDKIGRYKLLQQIGEGGCGVVYMAEQEEPVRRRVALKVIKLGMDTKNVIARFEAERQALALMDHPNIAKVFDAGATDTGRPFFVMELVRGTKITEFCDANKISTEERLKLFVQVCQAIQHAHQKGVIHRDIKPSNVLVTLRDGVPVPKVIDFGIAKATTDQRLTDKTVFTAFEQFIGTPAYMSPEQAEMSELGVDTRSDIYSLGVLLYELLTGLTPFDAKQLRQAGLDEIRRIIREDEPPRPSTRVSTLTAANLTKIAKQRDAEPGKLSGLFRDELDWIVMKAMEKDRTRRYATANGLAVDVQRHLADEPVTACPPSNLYRLQKSIRRYRTAYFTAAVFFILLLAGVIASMSEAVRAKRAELEQGRLRQRALEVGETLRQNLYAAEMTMANQVLDLNNGVRRISSVVSKWEYGQPDLRGWEWYYLNSLCHGEGLTLLGNGQRVNELAASPDGFRLAACYQDGAVRIWDVLSGKELFTLHRGSGPVNSVAWNPDGSRLAWSEGDKLVIWDVAAGKEAFVISATTSGINSITTIAWSHDGSRLAAGGWPKGVCVWNAITGQLVAQLVGHSGYLICAAWSPDDSRLATGSQDGTLRIWDAVAGKELFQPLEHSGQTRCLAWNSAGTKIASGSDDSQVKIWDAGTGRAVSTFRAPAVVTAVAWKPGTTQLTVACHSDATIDQWDVSVTNRLMASFRGHASSLQCLAWCPDGSWFASGDEGGEIKIWNPEANEAVVKNNTIKGGFLAVNWSPGGKLLAVATIYGSAYIFDPAAGKILLTLAYPNQSVSYVAWSRDGSRLAATTGGDMPESLAVEHPAEIRADNRKVRPVTIWDAKSGVQLLQMFGHTGAVNEVQWSPDDKRLVSVGADRTTRFWDAESGSNLLTHTAQSGRMLSVAWSPDGRRVVTGASGSPGTQILDANTGKELVTMNRPGTRYLAWSPDGTRLASAHEDGTVVISDPNTGKELFVFHGHTSGGLEVEWSPDGSRMLSKDRENVVKIWDPNDGRELLTFGGFSRATWSPDGLRIACVGPSKPVSLVIYDATTGYAVSRSAKSLPGLNRWLELHPDDLGYLRRRAEVFAAIGEWSKSAEDYQRILTHSKDGETRWCETGWWISQPVAGDLNSQPPPDNELNPAHPILAAKPAETSSMMWQPMSTAADNPHYPDNVADNPEAGIKPTIAYAQKRIWTPQNLSLKLESGVDQKIPLQLWLNRKFTELNPRSPGVVVALKAGWNTLLIKMSRPATNVVSVKLLPAS